ncbi:MAG: hypothetical protein WDN24_00795 [Sphingomonas sp.]
MTEAAQRLIGFELQFGAFAVAQLRLLAEMIALGAEGSPRLFVTDTLSDPYADEESGTGVYRELSKSRRDANQIKREQPITVVIGNPPYKEKAKGKGSWIESGSGNRGAPLNDWQPPAKWGVGAHAKHLRNLYVYFWRWAAWKVFEQGAGGRDRVPPQAERLSGMVCYITVAGFLNGPGFQKMRHDLRRECDEIWVIDCSPEGHQPDVSTRIFQGVQHPVCIVLASRSPANDPAVPARVRYRALARGRREAKFAELAGIALDSPRMERRRERLAGAVPAGVRRRLGGHGAAGCGDRGCGIGRDAGADVGNFARSRNTGAAVETVGVGARSRRKRANVPPSVAPWICGEPPYSKVCEGTARCVRRPDELYRRRYNSASFPRALCLSFFRQAVASADARLLNDPRPKLWPHSVPTRYSSLHWERPARRQARPLLSRALSRIRITITAEAAASSPSGKTPPPPSPISRPRCWPN